MLKRRRVRIVNLLSRFLLSIRGQYNTGYQYAMTLPGLHLYVHTSTHTESPKLWHCHGRCVDCWMVCLTCQQGCTEGGLSERPSAVTLVLSVHHERMAALWPSSLQLLGGDDCNVDALGGGGSVKKRIGDSSTKMEIHALSKLITLSNGGLSSCSPLSVRQICLMMQ